MSKTGELTAESVANYLQQNPDFFNQHLELLETLAIPHPSNGNVVSLVAKQLEAFRNKQQKLEQQLNSLVEIARDNDVSASRMHQLTLALLNATTLETAIANLKQVLIEVFLTDVVVLKIIGTHPNPALADYFITEEDENLHHVTAELFHNTPRCGRLNTGQSRFLFADFAPQVKSCAIVPIVNPQLTALLVIGSRNEDRFHYSLGTLFLTQLSEIISIRLTTLLRL